MDPERWNRLSTLLDELLELDPPVRARRLAEIVGVDAGLGDELQRMMSLEDERPDFLSQSVVDAAVFAPQPGQSIGPYKLETPIGEGGMGQVWLAIRDDGLYHRRVALKLLRPGLGDAGLRTRFTRERQILARLGHAHIARLLDAGVSSDGQPYLALDYVQGEPITDYARKLSLHPHDRLRLFLQVCAAVSHAHANLVVHRDLKPSNIMVTPAGEVCLLDFGIAKLLDESADGHDVITGTGTRAFTLHYAAPEQLRNGVITTMTDVYSLGVVLYELLVGRKPYDPARASDAAWEEAILTGDAVRPSVAAQRLARENGTPHPRRLASELAGDLDNILLKALAKAPEDRYVSVEAMAQDLRRHLNGKPVLARAQSLGYRTQKFVSRNSVGLIVAVSVVGLMVTALGFMYWQASKAIVEAQRAQAMQDFVVALFENTDQAGSGEGLDVRLLLDAGVRRADTELISQPQARAELLGLVVRLRQGLGDDRQALDLLDRQSQVLAALAGEAPARIGIESAALRGRSLRALGQPEVCVRALAPWMPVSEQQASEQPRTVSEFLSQLGRCHRQLGGLDVARDLFGKALAMRSGLADSKALQAESQTDLAGVLADEGRHAQAITAIRDALTLLRESGGDRNALGVEIWRDLGNLHRMVGDPLESEASYRQALEIALNRFGPSHPASTSVQRPLGAILIEAGKLTEAERLLRQAHERLLARFGPEHAEVAASWQTLGQLALEQGQLAQAQDALQRSLQLRRRSNDLGARGSVLCDLARTRLALGQAESAELLGHECLQQAMAFDPVLAARSERLLAEVARVQGNPQAAAALLASAKQRLLAAGIDPASRALAVIQLANARLLIDGGDLAQARAALDTLQAQPRRRGIGWDDVAWRTDALGARLLCRQGKADDGRVLATAALAAATARQPERQRTLDEIAEISSPCGRG